MNVGVSSISSLNLPDSNVRLGDYSYFYNNTRLNTDVCMLALGTKWSPGVLGLI